MKNILVRKCVVVTLVFLFVGLSMQSTASIQKEPNKLAQKDLNTESRSNWWNLDWAFRKEININNSIYECLFTL